MFATFRNAATALAASALFTTVTFAAAASSAHAATPAASIEQQIVDQGHFANFIDAHRGVATVAVQIDADGHVLHTGIAQSSGRKVFDDEALRTAQAIDYPKGERNRSVAIVLTFNGAPAPTAAKSELLVAGYTNSRGEALAAGAVAQPNS